MLIVIYSIYNNIIYILLILIVILINNDQVKSSQCYPIWWSWYIEKLSSKKWYLFVNIYSAFYHEIHRSTTLVVFHLREDLKKKKITESNILREQIFTFVSFPRMNRASGVVMQRQTIVLRHFHEPFCGIN